MASVDMGLKPRNRPRRWVSEKQFTLYVSDRGKTTMTIRLGRPYPYRGDFACPLLVCHQNSRVWDMVGVDADQAKTLAVRIARTELEIAIERGYSVVDADTGEPVVFTDEDWL